MSIQGGAAEENVVCTAWDISQPLITETVHLYEDIGDPWQSAKWSKVGTEAGFLLHGSSFLRNVKSYHVWKQDQQMAVPRGGREKMRRCQSEVPIVSNAILSTLELFIGLDGVCGSVGEPLLASAKAWVWSLVSMTKSIKVVDFMLFPRFGKSKQTNNLRIDAKSNCVS